jgi:chemotaxis protein CheD
VTQQRMVRLAEAVVGQADEVLVTLGLGSCVAVLLYDPEARVGGMAHVLLPDPSSARDTSNAAKFASTAVPLLVSRMLERGARRERLEARIVGGASMFSLLTISGAINMGARNVAACRGALETAGIPICGEEVGREQGRSVRFFLGDGRVLVTSAVGADVVL